MPWPGKTCAHEAPLTGGAFVVGGINGAATLDLGADGYGHPRFDLAAGGCGLTSSVALCLHAAATSAGPLNRGTLAGAPRARERFSARRAKVLQFIHGPFAQIHAPELGLCGYYSGENT